ncbi:hypothetical protein B9Z55_007230 [Caenorhabditis nigoni]|uniref:Domain of unknown function WSN domain-containing protein n=1 Tax=Caenorhabditis nigoni TaxID=1611254 RepID=A0A2G5V9D8_9PELO|nr:hypothetical protein B9Z55_007230 [Caenorhabditis nigoni]
MFSGIEQIMDRHLPLGRVFNALYLEMELDDKKIDGLDIVASMYNLKDRKSLEKLVSLKVDGLAEQLKTLDRAVKSVPEGIGQIADVDSIIEKYKMVQGINQTVRETMLKATIVEKVPVLKKPTASLDSFTNLKENLARKALTLLKDLKTTQDTITFDEFSNSIDDIKRFSMLPFLLKELEVLSENPLDHLVTGVRTAIEIQDKTVLFEELKKHLFETRTELTKLQPLISENLTFGRVEEILKTIGTVFKPYAELVKTISISAAFMSNHDLSSFKDDVSNNWIKSVLNEGRDLKDILSSLNEFKKTANTFNQHRNLLRTAWRAGISSSISRGVEFVSGLNNHTSLLHEFRIDLFLNCLNVSTAENKPQIEELVDLSKSLITLKLSVSSLKMITTKVDFSVIATKLDRLWQNLEDSSDDGSSSDWLDGREYHDIEKLLQELASTLDEMKQSDTLIEFVQSIETEGVKIKKAQEWIAGFQFIHPECDFMFKLDFNRFASFFEISTRF